MPGARDPDTIKLEGTWSEKWTQRSFLRLAFLQQGLEAVAGVRVLRVQVDDRRYEGLVLW